MEQQGCQHGVGRHFEELPFPVFRGGLDEASAADESAITNDCFAVIAQIVVVCAPPNQTLGTQEHQKDGQYGNRKTVLPQYSSHWILSFNAFASLV